MERLPTFKVCRIDTVKMVTLLKAIYRFIVMPTEIPTSFFSEIGKLITKFIEDPE
jgi:hypothetical protein